MMRLSSFAIALAVLFLAHAGAARAQHQTEVEGVRFAYEDLTRGLAGRGFVQVPVSVRNTADEPRAVELRAGYLTDDRWTRSGAAVTASFEAGEERELVLTVPTFVNTPGDRLRIDCTVDGVDTESMHVQFVHDDWPQNCYFVAVYSDRALGAGWEQQRAADLSRANVNRVAGAEHRAVFSEPSARWYPDGVTWRGGRGMTDAAIDRRRDLLLTQPTTDYAVVLREADQLPDSYVGLTSVDMAVLDGDGFEADQLAEVARWVRLGGCVLVARDDAFASLGELARARGPHNRVLSFGEVDIARFGLGTVIFAPGEPLETREQQLAVWWVHERSPSFVAPHYTQPNPVLQPLRWRMGSVQLPGIGEISHRTILALLIALAVVIGPVNMWLVKRTKRPVVFLVTAPALAFVGTLVVVAYGTARDGIGIKDAARSWAVLDQETNTISSLTMRRIFVGLSDGTRLRPGPGTVVLPMSTEDFGNNEDRYWIERDEDTGETVHGGAFLAVRRPILHAVHTDHSTRARIVAEREGGAVRVQNGLGAKVHELWLRDRDGRLWRTNGALGDGAAATLTAADGEDEALDGFLASIAPGPYLSLFSDLPPGSYAARTDAVVGEDDCQVRGTRISAEQSLVGHLEEGAL